LKDRLFWMIVFPKHDLLNSLTMLRAMLSLSLMQSPNINPASHQVLNIIKLDLAIFEDNSFSPIYKMDLFSGLLHCSYHLNGR
jgi:hypothetical protein